MRYLVDTSVLLEFLLEQEQVDGAEELIRSVPLAAVTDFALFSVAIILESREWMEAFDEMTDDLFQRGRWQLIRLSSGELSSVRDAMQRFGLDFDDAYQYAAAEQHDLDIVSFDDDFDATERGRLTPRQALRHFAETEE